MTPQQQAAVWLGVMLAGGLGGVVGYGIGLAKGRHLFAKAMRLYYQSQELARRLDYVRRCRNSGLDTREMEMYFATTPLDSQIVAYPEPPPAADGRDDDLPGRH
jgi:hypothetical protein